MRIGLAVTIVLAALALPVAADTVTVPAWHTVKTEAYPGKRDDIVFATAKIGYYGTGKGDFYRTDDGGTSWVKRSAKPGTFIRSVGFIDADHGFIGNVGVGVYPGVTDTNPLYETRDGGTSWTPVDLGGVTVEGICAIDILPVRRIYQGQLRTEHIVTAAGRVGGPAKMVRSTDGGATWKAIAFDVPIGMILDVKFLSPEVGLVFAGSSGDAAQSEAVILQTVDGGAHWRAVYRSGRKLENIWKASFPTARVGYATVQSYDPERKTQVVAKTIDGGDHWRELPIVENDKARQFGVGFVDAKLGWVGTLAGGFETRDGGAHWAPVPLARAANKIRTHAADGTPMVYAIGTEVQLR